MSDRELEKKFQELTEVTLLRTKDLLTVKDVANLYGISESAVRKMAQEHTLPYSRPFGKMLYFKKSELNEIFARNYVPSIQSLLQ